MNALEKIAKQQFLANNLKAGEEYAGILLGKNGEPNVHLILLPGEKESIEWKTSGEWAKEIGGDLPTRREQSLLFANLKEHFKGAAYWSSEEYASDTYFAWFQYFDYGSQDGIRKDDRLRARAVRRLIIE